MDMENPGTGLAPIDHSFVLYWASILSRVVLPGEVPLHDRHTLRRHAAFELRLMLFKLKIVTDSTAGLKNEL